MVKELPPIKGHTRPDWFQLQPAELDRILARFMEEEAGEGLRKRVVEELKLRGFTVLGSGLVGGRVRVFLMDRTVDVGRVAG